MAGFLEIAFDAVVAFDTREWITCWNPAAEQIFGWTAQEALGKTPAKLFWPVNTPEEKKDRRQRQLKLKRGKTLRGEHTSCRKDGSSLHVQYAARAIFGADKKLTGYLAIYRHVSAQEQDIAERKQKEETLRARTEEIETLLKVSPVAIFVAHDPECIRISANPAGYRMVGLSENSEANISKSAPAQERPTYRVFRNGVEVPVEDMPMQKAARLGVEVNEDELELRFEDGSQRFFYEFAKPLFDSQGKSRGAIAAMLDITAHRRAEEQLERSHQKLNEILASIQDDFYVLDRDWNFVYVNRQFTSRIGKEPEDFVGNNIWKMFPKHLGTVLEENYRAAMEKRQIRRFEIPGKYTNAWYSMTAFPSPEGITVLGTEITESKRSEQLIKESEERFRNIFNQSPIGIGVYNADGILTSLNPAAMEMFGISSPEKIVGLKLFSSPTVHAEVRMKLRNQEQIREEVVYDFDEIRRSGFYETTKSGVSYFDRIITPLRSRSTEKPFGYLSQVLDITERKRLEAETESMAKFPQENPNPVLRVSQEGVVLFGNRASQKLLDHWNCAIGRPVPEMWREKVTERFRLGVPGEAMLECNGRIFLLQLVPIIENHYLNIYGLDITERRQAEEQLERSHQKLNEILASIQDDFYVLDRDWNFVYANGQFTSRIKKEPQEIIGHNIWKVFPKYMGTVLEENLRTAMEKRELPRFEMLGEYTGRWYRMRVFPSAEGITVLGTDITARKQAEDALRENEKQLQLLNETLEQKVHEKTEEVRRLASDVVQAVQHERHRISHILHDDLQQRIYAIQMQLTLLHDEVQRENEAARKELSGIEQQLAEVLAVTRHLSIDLSPPILHDEGVSQAIDWLAAQMRQRYGLPIELQANGPFAIADEALHVLVFNCVRELLFNVVKHARASRAVVGLQWADDGLRIEVRDDGKGFIVDAPEQPASAEMNEADGSPSGFGLSTIRHQLNLFGGRMEIQSEPGAGARIILTVPVTEAG